MNAQSLANFLSNAISEAYAIFDSLNLSVTALTAIGLVLTVLLLFALREAASWFFKIDDLKKDVKHVRHLVVDMEAEVRMLHGLLSQNLKFASDLQSVAPVSTPAMEPNLINQKLAGNASPTTPDAISAISSEKSPRFVVTH